VRTEGERDSNRTRPTPPGSVRIAIAGPTIGIEAIRSDENAGSVQRDSARANWRKGGSFASVRRSRRRFGWPSLRKVCARATFESSVQAGHLRQRLVPTSPNMRSSLQFFQARQDRARGLSGVLLGLQPPVQTLQVFL
jgi:hypothetical protein